MNKKIIIKKYKWLIIILIIIFSIGCFYFIQQNENKNECIDKCEYRPATNIKYGYGAYWRYEIIKGDPEVFKTQNQCIDYCLRHK